VNGMIKKTVSVVALHKQFLASVFIVSSSTTAIAETIDVKISQDQIQVVSSAYEKSSSSVSALSVAYSRQFMGKWSGFAEYRNTVDNSLSAGILGLAFDTEESLTKGGFISGDGTPEIARIPIWLTRFSLGIGVFRLVDVLKSNDRSLGSRNLVPVKASPFGIKMGVSVQRFLNENWAVSLGGSYMVATAGDFGVSSLSFHMGVMYNLN
jgi:hypothetical protein